MNFLRTIAGKLTREQWILLVLTVAGAALRIEYLREFARLPHSDFAIGPDVMEYDARARELLSGRIFPATPEIHAPLYSWFLAGMYRLGGNSVGAARWMQLAMNFAAYLSLVPLLKKLGAPFKVQAAFLAAAMLTPVAVFHQAELISETLLAPLLALTLWMFTLAKERKRYLFGAGFGLGALILTHGLMLFFALAELLYFLIRRRWYATAMLAAGIAIPTVPVIAAKSLHYGHWETIQANGMYNLWIGHNPDATGGCYLRPGKMWRTPLENAKAEAARRKFSPERVFGEKIVEFYRNHPARAAILLLKKAGLLLWPGEPISGADPENLIRATPIQQLGAGAFGVVLVLAAAGVYFALRNRERAYVHFYLLTGAVAAGLLLTVAAGRYRQGMMPGLFLLAALGAVGWGRLRTGVVIACGVMLGWFLPSAAPQAEAASIAGEAYYRRGDYRKAEPLLQFAERQIDDPARFDNMLGWIAQRRGDPAEAERRYRRAIARDPDFADAWLNLGHLYFPRKDRRREAVALIREALKRNSALPSACNLLALDAVERRDFAAAERYFALAVKFAPENEGYLRNLALCRQLSDKKNKEGTQP